MANGKTEQTAEEILELYEGLPKQKAKSETHLKFIKTGKNSQDFVTVWTGRRFTSN